MTTNKRRLPTLVGQDLDYFETFEAMRGDIHALGRLRRDIHRARTDAAGIHIDVETFLRRAGLLDEEPAFPGNLTFALADILRMRPWRPDMFDALCERFIDLGWPVAKRCDRYANAIEQALREDALDIALAAIERAPHLMPIIRSTVTFATSIEDPVLVETLVKKIAASKDLDLEEPLGILFYEIALKSSADVILRAVDKRLLDYSTRIAAVTNQHRAFLMMVAAGGNPFNPENKHLNMTRHDTLPIFEKLRTAHGRMQLLQEYRELPERPGQSRGDMSGGLGAAQELRWRGGADAKRDPEDRTS